MRVVTELRLARGATTESGRNGYNRGGLPFRTAAERLSCVLGMLSSLEVKVLRPT